MSVFAALTGFWDWKRSTEKGTQARRTVNAHAWTMITVTVLVIVGIVVRLAAYLGRAGDAADRLGLNVGGATLTFLGGTIGGTLAFDYGFNVETTGDSPVWHPSETDVFPGDKHDQAPDVAHATASHGR